MVQSCFLGSGIPGKNIHFLNITAVVVANSGSSLASFARNSLLLPKLFLQKKDPMAGTIVLVANRAQWIEIQSPSQQVTHHETISANRQRGYQGKTFLCF